MGEQRALPVSLSARVSADVRAAMQLSGVTADDVASAAHLSVWTVRSRLSGRVPWTDVEARSLRGLLDSPPPRRLPVWLRAAEVAALFGVDRRTVSRWAMAGRLPAARTDGGHWRFRSDVVTAHLESAGYMMVERIEEDA